MADKIKNYGITGTAANIQLGKGGPIISGANANVIVLTDSSSNAAAIITAEGTENSHAVTLSQLEPITADKLKYQDFTVAHDGGTYNLANATANTRIVNVVVEASAAWSNADSNTTITVGDVGDEDRLFTAFDPEVQSSADPNHTYSTETTVKAVVTAGGATAGNATVTVWYAGELTEAPQEAPPILVSGQEEFLTAGTFSWTAPEGVTSVSAVCIGGGGGGSSQNGEGGHGGAGGGLGWKNNIAVTPGTSYTVVVGSGGERRSGSPPAGTGGDSYFINTSTVAGFGGQGGADNSGATGGSYVGDGGGAGGNVPTHISTAGATGGGGAGGYSGNGGAAGALGTAGNAGSGGGGGGGGAGGAGDAGGAGGGVGIFGQGANGTAGTYSGSDAGPGGGGSGGAAGSASPGSTFRPSTGGLYGGGGAGAEVLNEQGPGAGGAVRIIWGTGRSFPSTNTGNV